MPKIIHYRKKCIGCNICFEMQPDYWRLSKRDGKATLLNATIKKEVYITEITEEYLALSQMVAKSCPVNIIKIDI